MGKSILILNDDVDFNSLLTDIFTQADYDVFSEQDPERALEIFQSESFDLVVTDQKMPNLSGAEFMRKIKSIRSNVPVIMVSGYLDNETIRDLIKEGVGGVFLKPLNVFSLLKRTSELIEESENESSSQMGESQAPFRSEFASSLPFKFRSYPCRSEASASFAKKLYSLHNFKSNLLLIGRPGIAFKSICEDLIGFSENTREQYIYLSNEQIDEGRLNPLIARAEEQKFERVTLVLLEAQHFNEAQKNLILKLNRREGDYADLSVPVRIIFCLNEDLDVLYEMGTIDENLYILMGTSEARAPNLSECPEDIPILAQQYVVDAMPDSTRASVPRIDKTGRQWLQEQSWPENHQQLREFMVKVVSRVKEDLLTMEHFKRALTETGDHEGEISNESFINKLIRARNAHARAMLILCEGDREAASRHLEISGELLEEILVSEL